MSEKKNIDRLFQEKLKDFEVAPPEQSWEDISSRLPQNNKPRRVIPMWFRVSGVAAVLLLGLMLSLPIFKSGNDPDTIPVVFEDNGSNTQPNGNNTINRNGTIPQPGNAVTDNGTDASVSTMNNNTTNKSTGGTSNSVSRDYSNSTNEKPVNGNNTKNTKGYINKVGQPVYNNNTVAYENAKAPVTKPRKKISSNIQEKTALQDNSTGVAHSSKSGKHRSGKDNSKNNTITNTNNLSSNTTNTAQQVAVSRENSKGNKNNSNSLAEKYTSGITKQAAVAANSGQENNSEKNNENSAATIIDKDVTKIIGSINPETAVAEVAVDSVKKENELEKLAQQIKEDKDKEEELAINDADKTRWKIKPQLAPLFYSSMTEGSPIDEQFAGNSKTYDNDLSYGLGINYSLNNRFSIRTGINTVNLSYTTNNIQFYASLDQSTPNISTASGTTANLVVENQYGPSGDPTASLPTDDVPTPKYEGSMVQRTGYIEVPLEMSYKLLDRRFGIDIIGGVSTLFLNRNNVSVVSAQGYRSELGEADNLNNVHFSTNIGVGFKYRFWKSFEASVEPIVKYQVNTFSNNPGNFRPYFVGLYSGISFSF